MKIHRVGYKIITECTIVFVSMGVLAWLRVSTSSLRFASSAAYFSASLTALSISSLDILVEEVMVMCCSLPVPRSYGRSQEIWYCYY